MGQGIYWATLSTATQQALSFLVVALTARWLGAADFGVLGMVQVTIGMTASLAGLGLGVTIIKFVSQYRANEPHRASAILSGSMSLAVVSGLLMSLALFAFAPQIAASAFSAPAIASEVRLAALMVVPSVVVELLSATLSGLEAFRSLWRTSLWRGLLNLPIVLPAVYLWGLKGAIAGQVLVSFSGVLVTWLALSPCLKSNRMRWSAGGFATEAHALWGFSLPALLAGIMVGPVMWLAKSAIFSMPRGPEEMGIFSAAERFQAVLSPITIGLGNALLPLLSSASAAESKILERRNILLSWAVGAVPAMCLMALPEIQEVVFGKDFGGDRARITLDIYMLGFCVTLFNQGIARQLMARSHMWLAFVNNAVWGVVLLAMSYALRREGAIGLAVAYFLAYAIKTLVFIPIFVKKGLVPKGTIFTMEAGIIWLALGSVCAASASSMPIAWRLVGATVAALIIGAAFYRLARPDKASLLGIAQ